MNSSQIPTILPTTYRNNNNEKLPSPQKEIVSGRSGICQLGNLRAKLKQLYLAK